MGGGRTSAALVVVVAGTSVAAVAEEGSSLPADVEPPRSRRVREWIWEDCPDDDDTAGRREEEVSRDAIRKSRGGTTAAGAGATVDAEVEGKIRGGGRGRADGAPSGPCCCCCCSTERGCGGFSVRCDVEEAAEEDPFRSSSSEPADLELDRLCRCNDSAEEEDTAAADDDVQPSSTPEQVAAAAFGDENVSPSSTPSHATEDRAAAEVEGSSRGSTAMTQLSSSVSPR